MEFLIKTKLMMFSSDTKRQDKPNRLRSITVTMPLIEKRNFLTAVKCSPTIKPRGKAKELAHQPSIKPVKYMTTVISTVTAQINGMRTLYKYL